MNETTTITHIAKPEDSRCAWFQGQFNGEINIAALDGGKTEIKYFNKGDDLELEEGDLLIDSEAIHHRQSRGYNVNLGVVKKDKIIWIEPTMAHKMMIKEEGHKDLMKGSGQKLAVIRLAIWVRRQENIHKALEKLGK